MSIPYSTPGPGRAYNGPTGEVMSVHDAAQHSLAERVGIEISGIQSANDIRRLYVAQGAQLLIHAEISVRYMDSATRNLRNSTKHEALFDEITDTNQPRAYVIPAFAPPRGFDYQEEQERGKPMRMSFGFVFEQPDDSFAVLRPTLWITRSKQNPHDIKVIKNTKEPLLTDSVDEVNYALWHTSRDASRDAR